jgi:hypothetical protein
MYAAKISAWDSFQDGAPPLYPIFTKGAAATTKDLLSEIKNLNFSGCQNFINLLKTDCQVEHGSRQHVDILTAATTTVRQLWRAF